MAGDQVAVHVEGRVLRLTNLDKELYPDSGNGAAFTKREVIDYYVAVAPVLLPRLAGRPVTMRRYPDGALAEGFFEKHAARHAPDWVRTAHIPSKRYGDVEYVLIEDLPSLVWAANLAALELHVPQYTVTADGDEVRPRVPDQLVFDLDPGEPATVVECCRAAELIHQALAADGLTGFPKTSGSKGLQLYVPVAVDTEQDTSRYAKALAERLAGQHGDLVLANMTRAARAGRVFIDWSQNNPAKTTIAAYSLRARSTPTVSTPVTWDEVRACGTVDELTFTAGEVRERIAEHGDLLADLDEHRAELPG